MVSTAFRKPCRDCREMKRLVGSILKVETDSSARLTLQLETVNKTTGIRLIHVGKLLVDPSGQAEAGQ
jgi:hypothetical protein